MASNPKVLCGAKKKTGGTCERAPMPNGRCYLHGGKAGRPPKTGRGAVYLKIFGQRFAQLASDPELLKANHELALFDTFLTERAELLKDGFSAAWVDEISSEFAALKAALFQAPDAARVRVAMETIGKMLDEGRSRAEAWQEVLSAAKARSEIAVKADAVLAKREQTVTESQMMALFVRWMDITVQKAGPDIARDIGNTFEREAFGHIRPSDGAVRSPATN